MLKTAQAFDKPRPDPAATAKLVQLLYGRFVGQAVCLAAKLAIPDRIAAGEATTASLAAALGAEPDSLRRYLRALASFGVLAEGPADTFSLSPAGVLLRSDVEGSLAGLARLFATREHALAWLELEGSVRKGTSAFLALQGMGAFEQGKTDAAFNRIFNEAMSSIAGALHKAIADAYAFDGIGLLVDVGGGHGRLLAEILARHPRMQGIVYDLPHVVDGAGATLAAAGLSKRAKSVAGSFFEAVPEGADAYIMTAILHDWDDSDCVTILRACRQAMRPDGRVLVGDFVLKPPNEPDLGRSIDLEMLVMTPGGRERTLEEFAQLMDAADLKIAGVTPLPAGHSLIEARPRA